MGRARLSEQRWGCCCLRMRLWRCGEEWDKRACEPGQGAKKRRSDASNATLRCCVARSRVAQDCRERRPEHATQGMREHTACLLAGGRRRLRGGRRVAKKKNEKKPTFVRRTWLWQMRGARFFYMLLQGRHVCWRGSHVFCKRPRGDTLLIKLSLYYKPRGKIKAWATHEKRWMETSGRTALSW